MRKYDNKSRFERYAVGSSSLDHSSILTVLVNVLNFTRKLKLSEAFMIPMFVHVH